MSSQARLAKRTNTQVKAIFKVVELRGLEPLTFSLRRLHLRSEQPSQASGLLLRMHSGTGRLRSGAHRGHTADRFHAMPAPLGVLVRFNGWRESVTVQASRPFDRVEVAHLVAQRPKPRTGLLDGSSG